MNFSPSDLKFFRQANAKRKALEESEQRLLHSRLSGDAAFLRVTDRGYETGRDPDPSGLMQNVYEPDKYGRLPTQLPPVKYGRGK